MIKPKVCVLRSDGANCDEELFYAFEKFGADPEMVHVNKLRDKSKHLKNYQVIALPGGFSYGDDISSGKILAIELVSFLKEQLQEFLKKDTLIFGICNGFQTLVRTGLLPNQTLEKMDLTLAQNESGHFECRWVKVKMAKNNCVFLKSTNQILDIAVNHGEGKLFSTGEIIKSLEKNNQIVFQYADAKGKPTSVYPQNPNGSTDAIAAITDKTGRILGMMPHPEKFVDITQHPNWRRQKFTEPHGAFIFKSIVQYFQ